MTRSYKINKFTFTFFSGWLSDRVLIHFGKQSHSLCWELSSVRFRPLTSLDYNSTKSINGQMLFSRTQKKCKKTTSRPHRQREKTKLDGFGDFPLITTQIYPPLLSTDSFISQQTHWKRMEAYKSNGIERLLPLSEGKALRSSTGAVNEFRVGLFSHCNNLCICGIHFSME